MPSPRLIQFFAIAWPIFSSGILHKVYRSTWVKRSIKIERELVAKLRKVKRKRKLKELHEQKSKDQKRLGGRAGRFRT